MPRGDFDCGGIKWRLMGAEQGHGELTHLEASIRSTQGLLPGCGSFLETLHFLSES